MPNCLSAFPDFHRYSWIIITKILQNLINLLTCRLAFSEIFSRRLNKKKHQFTRGDQLEVSESVGYHETSLWARNSRRHALPSGAPAHAMPSRDQWTSGRLQADAGLKPRIPRQVAGLRKTTAYAKKCNRSVVS